MPTKKPIVDLLRQRLTEVAERGRVIGQALKVRADMAATRRRLRQTFTELGEETYGRLVDGRLIEEGRFVALRQQIDGLKAEVRLREEELRHIMQGGSGGCEAQGEEPSASPATGAEAGTTSSGP